MSFDNFIIELIEAWIESEGIDEYGVYYRTYEDVDGALVGYWALEKKDGTVVAEWSIDENDRMFYVRDKREMLVLLRRMIGGKCDE